MARKKVHKRAVYGTSLTAAAIYRDLVKVSGYSRSQAVKKHRRRNGAISRAHRLESSLFMDVPSVKDVRAAMQDMAKIYRTTRSERLRHGAATVYVELLSVLKQVELGDEAGSSNGVADVKE